MSEIRKDYFTDRLVIFHTSKKKTDIEEEMQTLENKCSYCQGNESSTPPADLVLVQSGNSLAKLSDAENEFVKDWAVRVFSNKSPIMTQTPNEGYSDSPLFSEPAFGYHYIIVATPNHDKTLSNLDIDQWINVLATIQDKMRWLYGKKGVSYVAVYSRNRVDNKITSNHAHFEAITFPRLPPILEQEATTAQKSMHELGTCPMCNVLNVETGGPRQILSTDLYLAFTPWASSYPYEFWIVPKRHQTSFLKTSQKEIGDLALIIRSTLGGLSKALNNPAFNLIFHTSSEKKTTKQIHWHIEIYPGHQINEGLNLGTGIFNNSIRPEQAAEILGSKSRKELAHLIGVE